MKASTFAQKIINNLIFNNKLSKFEFVVLRDLCLYSNPKKQYFFYTSEKKICFGGFFYKYANVISFFEGLGIKYGVKTFPHNVYSDLFIEQNTFRNIKPFLDEIRTYFIEKYNVKVEHSKYDGSTISVSNPSNVTKETILEAIKFIANNKKEVTMVKKNFIYNVHFLIIDDGDARHENYPFTLKKNAEEFFKTKVKEEKKNVSQREKEQDEEWVIEKEQGTKFTEYDMYRTYASNIDRVSIRLEKLELN